MKIDFFKNNFKKKTSEINPKFYWGIVFFITLVAIIVFLFFGYYIFVNTNKEPASGSASAAGQVGTVNKDSIENVLNLFSERVQTSSQILNSPAPVVDPSQ